MYKIVISCISILTLSLGTIKAQPKFTISGTIKDSSNGETLIGAALLVKEISNGTVSNVYGFYSITLPAASYNLEFSYIGYKSITRKIELNENVRIDIELIPESVELEGIVIEAEEEESNDIRSIEMSTNKLDATTITKIPAFLGEADIIKSIQLLPGVSTVGEGASGFNVRGGSVGQNLILLDEAPVYNSSHLLGFFSVFNPDAVKDIKLYKGAVPSRYGGRLASLLDVRMKEGNNKKFEVGGGIGTVFSRIAVEGPLIKEKASFIVAARRSYIDVLARPFVELLQDGGALNFYDINVKTNYTISKKIAYTFLVTLVVTILNSMRIRVLNGEMRQRLFVGIIYSATGYSATSPRCIVIMTMNLLSVRMI